MKWRVLVVAIAAGLPGGCAFDTSSHNMFEVDLSRQAPVVDLGAKDSLRMESVEADGTVMLKSVANGRVYACRKGETTPLEKSGIARFAVEILASHAGLQTARVRADRLTRLRVAVP